MNARQNSARCTLNKPFEVNSAVQPRHSDAALLNHRPKPDKPELNSLRREGATPTQAVGAYLNVWGLRPCDE